MGGRDRLAEPPAGIDPASVRWATLRVMSPASQPEIPCGMLPPVPIDDLTLVRLYRREAGEDEVSEAIAEVGADAAIKAMRQRHRAHTVALGLRHVDLHQRAELLYQELGIPEPSASTPAIETDADRGRYFRAVVLRLLDREVESKLREMGHEEADAEARMWLEDDDPNDPNNWV